MSTLAPSSWLVPWLTEVAIVFNVCNYCANSVALRQNENIVPCMYLPIIQLHLILHIYKPNEQITKCKWGHYGVVWKFILSPADLKRLLQSVWTNQNSLNSFCASVLGCHKSACISELDFRAFVLVTKLSSSQKIKTDIYASERTVHALISRRLCYRNVLSSCQSKKNVKSVTIDPLLFQCRQGPEEENTLILLSRTFIWSPVKFCIDFTVLQNYWHVSSLWTRTDSLVLEEEKLVSTQFLCSKLSKWLTENS